MASMAATCFTLQQTFHPRLAFSNSLFPNPRSPLKTSFPVCFSFELGDPRILAPVCIRPRIGAAGIIALARRPQAAERLSDHETSPEPEKDLVDSIKSFVPEPEKDFVDSIKSFVFGDGDPNKVAKEQRWKLIGQIITSKGGVVTAEEIAPYLDNPLQSSGENDGHSINDEMFMVPVLMRYDGQPVIDEEGNVLYRFISLQPTANGLSDPNFVGGKLLEQKFFVEEKWRFSKTSLFEKATVLGFGVLCWIWSCTFYDSFLKTLPGGTAMLPVLKACAIIFFTAIPLLRLVLFCVVYLKRNADIEKRNQTRQRCARDLESPDLRLKRKLQTARDMARKLTMVMSAGQDDLPVNVYGASTSANITRDLVEDV